MAPQQGDVVLVEHEPQLQLATSTSSEEVEWHDCLEAKGGMSVKKRRTSQLVADRLEWMHTNLLSSPTSERAVMDSIPKDRRKSSDFVTERKRLLEASRRLKEEPKSARVAATQDLVAERLLWLEERTTSQEGEGEQVECHTQRSSEMVAERARFLEEWSAHLPPICASTAPANATSDLVQDRKRLLEERHRLQQSEKITQQRQTNDNVSSDLVAERAKWLEEWQLRVENQAQSSSSQVQEISSDLVAARALWLEERRWQSTNQQASTSSDRVDRSLLQGLTSERSKWLQWWSGGNKNNNDNTQPTINDRPPPGKLDPTRMVPVTSTAFSAGQSTSTALQKEAVFGSLAEKRARFAVENNETKTETRGRLQQQQQQKHQRWGELYMPHVDQKVQETGFLGHAMVELEQEGLLPNFLAEPTRSWLFGAAKADPTVPEPAAIDLLRLDYQLMATEKANDETPLTEASHQQEEGTENEKEDSLGEKVEDIYFDLPVIPPEEGSVENEAPLLIDETNESIVEEEINRELFLDKANKPWSEMSYEECKEYRKDVVCSFCAVM